MRGGHNFPLPLPGAKGEPQGLGLWLAHNGLGSGRRRSVMPVKVRDLQPMGLVRGGWRAPAWVPGGQA